MLKFFFINYMMGVDEKHTHNQVMETIDNSHSAAIKIFKDDLDYDIFNNFESLIDGLGVYIPELNKIRLKKIYEGVIKNYGTSTIFMVDNFDYFAINIAYVVCGSFMNNQYALEKSIEHHGGGQFFTNLMRV